MLHLQASSADLEAAESLVSKVRVESQYFIISEVSPWRWGWGVGGGGQNTLLKPDLFPRGLSVACFL